LRKFAVLGCAAFVLIAWTWIGYGQEVGEATQEPGSAISLVAEPTSADVDDVQEISENGLPVFRGQFDVSLINLFVSVLDGKGQPVTGLTKNDFEVFENGKPMEITNFEAIERRELTPVDVDDRALPADVEAQQAPDGRFVAILFDNPSLERKTRKRVLKALESFVEKGLEQNDEFMIALNTGKLEILKPFNSNEAGLKAALRSVADIPTAGDSIKKRKRFLKRTVYSTEIYEQAAMPNMANFDGNTAYAVSSAQRLHTEILNMRRLERQRIRQALGVTNELLQALAGLDGRKSVIWVGEDMAIRPVIDIYTVYYSRAAPLKNVMIIDPPEIWGEQDKLDREFATVAASAQAAGATVFMIDASDRDREMANADYSPSNVASVLLSESADGGLWTPGANFAEVRQLSEGGEFMAGATGGDSFGNTRQMDKVMDTLSDRVSTYYYLGYRRDGPPDGKRHDIKVRAAGKNRHVRHHEQVLDKTTPQKLADMAMSRLRLDLGENDLDLALALDRPESSDKNTVILPIQLMIPVEKLVLLPEADHHIGQILVAVAVLDDKGNTAPVHLIRLRLSIPVGRYTDDAIASRSIKLRIKDGTTKIAVGVRDEISGIQSSQVMAVPANLMAEVSGPSQDQEAAESSS
jgi:VWFA-related protein